MTDTTKTPATCHLCGSEDAPTQCHDCGQRCCTDCMRRWGALRYCADCAPHCWECGRDDDPGESGGNWMPGWCETCGRPVCTDCRRTCQGCGDPCCYEDVYYPYGDDSDEPFCPGCSEERHSEPRYLSPYAGNAKARDPFTFGLEIEVEGGHDQDALKNGPLIAGWCLDGSMHEEGSMEYQTNPLTADPGTLRDLHALVDGIRPDMEQEHSGGHMHLSRTPRQRASRWYWALSGLDEHQADDLHMRHLKPLENSWCQLSHGHYGSKFCAVNDEHYDTIELRTFGPWHHGTAGKLIPAITWAHTMWRYFQHHETGTLRTTDIQAMSRTAYRAAMPAPLPLSERLAARRHEEVTV